MIYPNGKRASSADNISTDCLIATSMSDLMVASDKNLPSALGWKYDFVQPITIFISGLSVNPSCGVPSVMMTVLFIFIVAVPNLAAIDSAQASTNALNAVIPSELDEDEDVDVFGTWSSTDSYSNGAITMLKYSSAILEMIVFITTELTL